MDNRRENVAKVVGTTSSEGFLADLVTDQTGGRELNAITVVLSTRGS